MGVIGGNITANNEGGHLPEGGGGGGGVCVTLWDGG